MEGGTEPDNRKCVFERSKIWNMEYGNDLKIEVTRTMQMLKDIYAGLEQKNQRVLEITKSELDLNYEIYEK